MPVVRFLQDFDWKPIPAVTTGYKKGMVKLVTTACSAAAISKGRAELITKPRRRKNAGQDQRG